MDVGFPFALTHGFLMLTLVFSCWLVYFPYLLEAGQKSFKGKIREGCNFSLSHIGVKRKVRNQRHTLHSSSKFASQIKARTQITKILPIFNEGEKVPRWSQNTARKHVMVLSRKKLIVANINWCQPSVITVKSQVKAAARASQARDPGFLKPMKNTVRGSLEMSLGQLPHH